MDTFFAWFMIYLISRLSLTFLIDLRKESTFYFGMSLQLF